MRISCVGLADEFGVHMLVPETAHAGVFAVRRSCRMNSVCFWTVLEEPVYLGIRRELDRGNLLAGMWLLKSYADEIGTILPSTYAATADAEFAA